MVIGGLEKLSLSDFPGRLSAVVFTQGCTLHCGYCHNPKLLGFPLPGSTLDERDVLGFLETRRTRLQGVVLSGGEPCLQRDLCAFAASVRAMGYAVKLDTNGTRPAMVKALLAAALLDYVALDVKAPPAAFQRVTGNADGSGAVLETLALLATSGVDWETRTTWAPCLLSRDELLSLAPNLGAAPRCFLQALRTGVTLDPALRDQRGPTRAELTAARDDLRARGVPAFIRE